MHICCPGELLLQSLGLMLQQDIEGRCLRASWGARRR